MKKSKQSVRFKGRENCLNVENTEYLKKITKIKFK